MFDLLQMKWFPAGFGTILDADGGVGLMQSSGMVNMFITSAFFCMENISHSVTFAGSERRYTDSIFPQTFSL